MKMLGMLGVAFALALAPVSVPSACQAMPAEHSAEDRLVGLDQEIENLLRLWNGVGIGLAIVANGRVIRLRGYGSRDVARHLPFTPETRFPIGSNTKLFTALLAGALVEDGRLTWDQPLHARIPSFQLYDDALTDQVTLRDLLANRVGISRYDTMWYGVGRTSADLFARLRHLEPEAPLRTRFIYNNVLYAAVGRVIEIETGAPYADVLRRRLLDPLGMAESSISPADLFGAANHAEPAMLDRGTRRIVPRPFIDWSSGGAPAIGLVSTLDDMSRWLQFLLGDGSAAGIQPLGREVVRETMKPVIPLENDNLAAGWTEIQQPAYGLGREISVYRGHRMTNHGGSTNGFHSQVALLPDDGIGVVVFTIGTHTSELPNVISYAVFDRLLGLQAVPWGERLRKARAEREAGRAAAPAAIAKSEPPSRPVGAYTGIFENPIYGQARIVRHGRGLSLRLLGTVTPLISVGRDRFEAILPANGDDAVLLAFEADRRGGIGSVRIILDGRERPFPRTDDSSSLIVRP